MLFSSSAQRWEILKKHVELSIKSQSDTRWESRIKCIKPLRYNLKRGVAGTERLGSHFHRKKRWKSCLRNKIVDSSFIKMEFSFVGVYLV